jgi:hypothetical protein
VAKKARMNGKSKLKAPGPPIAVGSLVAVEVPKDQAGMGMPRLPAVVLKLTGPSKSSAVLWCPAGVISTK